MLSRGEADDRARVRSPNVLPRERWLPVMLWMLVGGACCALVSGLEPNLLEEGIELHVAQRLAQGEVLYRDVLVFTGPFPFELLAALFRIFGEEIWVARSVVIVLHALATGAAFAIARGSRSDALAHAAAGQIAAAPVLLFPLFGIYYYTTIAFHLSLIAAWAAWRGIHRIGWAVIAGGLVATVALCKQTIGLSLAVALGLGLLFAAPATRRTRAALGFACGGAGVAVLTIALWAASGSLDEAIYGMVTLPSSLQDLLRPAVHRPLAARRALLGDGREPDLLSALLLRPLPGHLRRADLAGDPGDAAAVRASAVRHGRNGRALPPGPAARGVRAAERPLHRLALEPRPALRLGPPRARASAAHRPAHHRGAVGAPSVALAANRGADRRGLRPRSGSWRARRRGADHPPDRGSGAPRRASTASARERGASRRARAQGDRVPGDPRRASRVHLRAARRAAHLLRHQHAQPDAVPRRVPGHPRRAAAHDSRGPRRGSLRRDVGRRPARDDLLPR